jgi:hypothetical protein
MEQTECSETFVFKLQKTMNNPEESLGSDIPLCDSMLV